MNPGEKELITQVVFWRRKSVTALNASSVVLTFSLEMKVFTALLFLIQVFLGYSIPLFGLSIIVTFIIYIQIYCSISSATVTLSFEEWQTTKVCFWSAVIYVVLLDTIRSRPGGG